MSTSRLQQLLTLQEDSPGDSFLLFAIAKEYEGMDNPEQALHHYCLLVKNDPDYVGVYYHLGKLYEQLSQPEEALAVYRQGMEVARRQGDQHALSELAGARLFLEEEED